VPDRRARPADQGHGSGGGGSAPIGRNGVSGPEDSRGARRLRQAGDSGRAAGCAGRSPLRRESTRTDGRRGAALPAHGAEREPLGGRGRRVALPARLSRLGGGALTGARENAGTAGADLLARAQRGDRAALDELCREEWPAVYRLVAGRLASRQEAEDVTQEVFLRALRHLDAYRSGSGSFRPYLIAVARNLLRDRWRSERRVGWADADPDSLATGERGPEAAALAAEERAALAAGLARLSPAYRSVLRLRLLEGRSAADTAALLGRSPEAVRQLQHRALVALRAALAGDEREGSVDHD
jgi:RNA polymerase sigma-70 factor, ECF subfamily